MADHLTEEEQIEAIKRWWNDNWLSVVLPIVIAIFAYTGWNYWTDYKQAQAANASEQYETLTKLLEGAGTDITQEQRNEALTLANELHTNYAGTLYSDLSAMILAKLYVDDQKLAEAESTLRDVVDKPATDSISAIAKVRLAKVLLAQGNYTEALTLVSQSDADSVKALYAETRGDIYLAQGEIAAAYTAYEEALSALSPKQYSHRGIVQFKLDGTKSGVALPASEVEEPQPELVVETAGEETASVSSEDMASEDQE